MYNSNSMGNNYNEEDKPSLHYFKEGLKRYNNVIERDPSNIESHTNKLSFCLQHKHYEEAIEELDFLIKLNPNESNFHGLKASALFYLNRYQEAIEEWDITILKE